MEADFNADPAAADTRFRQLFELAPDALMLVDEAGRILLANSQIEKLFGYSGTELIGQPVEILVPEQIRSSHAQHRSHFQATSSYRPMGTGLDLYGRRKDGTTFSVEISLSPWQDGSESLVMASIRDVTDRKQTAEKLLQVEERFRLLVQEVKDYAIFMLDPGGRVMTWNEGAQRIKGYRADEILAQPFSRFFTSEDIERRKPEEALKIASTEGRWEDGGWRIRKDGSRFWASVVLTALHDREGKLVGFAKVTRDVTEGKRAQEAFLLEMTNALVSNLDIRQLLTAIASCLRQVKSFDYATLALFDERSKAFHVQMLETVVGGAGFASTEESWAALVNSPVNCAYAMQKALRLRGSENEDWPYKFPVNFSPLSLRSACWIPVVGRDGALGTLNLYSRKLENFTDHDLTLLTQIAGQVAVALENALAFRRVSELNERLAEEKLYLEDELKTEFNFDEIVGQSKAIKRTLHQVETVAPTDSTVLILGETGTGKELLARIIHDLSPRRGHTFVRVNCASIPAGLLESELFGHEKGAFTGAIAQRVGRLELAHQGTMFLDEVGDIPAELQPKLLRVLQEKEFERLGSNRTISSDVRIVAATNRDLGKMVAAGQFRSDLFYRLEVFPIVVPPLRERREDIPLLVQYFLTKFAKKMKKNIDTVPPAGMEALCRYSWPGNIRELEHLIERAVILSRGPILSVPRFESITAPEPEIVPAVTLENVERDHIIRVLRQSHGKVGGPGGAAERLGMNRTTLNSRMLKLKISRKDF